MVGEQETGLCNVLSWRFRTFSYQCPSASVPLELLGVIRCYKLYTETGEQLYLWWPTWTCQSEYWRHVLFTGPKVALLSMKKVRTSLESCFFVGFKHTRESLGKFVLVKLLYNALTRYNIDVCGVSAKKLCFEIILFVATFFGNSECLGRLLVQSHPTGLKPNK